MAQVTAGMAGSHAYTLASPVGWYEHRKKATRNCERKYGFSPPIALEIEAETLEDDAGRFCPIEERLGALRAGLMSLADAFVLIGGLSTVEENGS